MAITLKAVLATAIPALATIFGLLWFTRRKKKDAIEPPKDVKPKEHVTPRQTLTSETMNDNHNLSADIPEDLPFASPVSMAPCSKPAAQDNKVKQEDQSGEKILEECIITSEVCTEVNSAPNIAQSADKDEIKHDVTQAERRSLEEHIVSQNSTDLCSAPTASELPVHERRNELLLTSDNEQSGKTSSLMNNNVNIERETIPHINSDDEMNKSDDVVPIHSGCQINGSSIRKLQEHEYNMDDTSVSKDSVEDGNSKLDSEESGDCVKLSEMNKERNCEELSDEESTRNSVESQEDSVSEEKIIEDVITESQNHGANQNDNSECEVNCPEPEQSEECVLNNLNEGGAKILRTQFVEDNDVKPQGEADNAEMKSSDDNHSCDEVSCPDGTKSPNVSNDSEVSKKNRLDETDGSTTGENWGDVVSKEIVSEEVSLNLDCSKSAQDSQSSGASGLCSPAEVSSQSGVNSSHSDAQSEVSADSGNASSIAESSQSKTIETATSKPQGKVNHQFNFPSQLCGMLIGAKGKNIKDLKDRSGCEISVKDKIYEPELKLISLEGSQRQIDKALDILKRRFPPHKFGPIDFTEAVTDHPTLSPEIMQLSLPEGVCIDVNVSSVVAANHLFLQQPTHPSFHMLEKQNTCMMMCYVQDGIVPQLPRPVEVGVICAAPMYNGWYRAQVVETYEESDECYIKFVDYGGYMRVQSCGLRQIRSDFTTLPFQGVECYLANVIPPKDMLTFPQEANAVLEELVHNQVLQAEVVGYEEDGVPYVQLYEHMTQDNSLRLVNRELVNRGVARWMEHQL